jgi:hypothetical protein
MWVVDDGNRGDALAGEEAVECAVARAALSGVSRLHSHEQRSFGSLE